MSASRFWGKLTHTEWQEFYSSLKARSNAAAAENVGEPTELEGQLVSGCLLGHSGRRWSGGEASTVFANRVRGELSLSSPKVPCWYYKRVLHCAGARILLKSRLIQYEGRRFFTSTVHITKRQEEFSLAYVRAVAAVAGFATSVPTPDNDSVDLNLRKKSADTEESDEGHLVAPQLDLQMKCTGRNIIRDSALHLPLKLKNYNDLRRELVLVPRILVVHCIPPDPEEWLEHSEDNMVLRHCSYWVSLKGKPALPAGQESVVVHIPRANRFTPEAVSAIMGYIERGEPL